MMLSPLRRLPLQDIGRGLVQVAIDAAGVPFFWFTKRVDRGYYLKGTYRFLRFRGETVELLPIPPMNGSHPRLVPFTDGRLLVIFARHREAAEDNAFVYSPSGELQASFCTLDAVEDVQIAVTGDIWVSYFDENLEGELDCFDQSGRTVFRFRSLREQHDLPSMIDCYALNVASAAETWVYYYDDFPLLRLVGRQLAGRWDASAISGAHAFAVDGRRALFAGTYDERDSLFFLDLASGAVEQLQPVYGDSSPVRLSDFVCVGRGTRLYLHDGRQLYVVELGSL